MQSSSPDNDRSISSIKCKYHTDVYLFHNGIRRVLDHTTQIYTTYNMYICPKCRHSFGYKDPMSNSVE